MRLRRSIQKMKNDPLSIIIALNLENKSDGIIYFDDEESLEYQNNKYSILKISYEKSEINFDWMLYNYQVYNNIEKIIILGENNEFLYNKNTKIELITIKNDKINLEFMTDFGNKKIDIIRLNKYKLTDIQKIILTQKNENKDIISTYEKYQNEKYNEIQIIEAQNDEMKSGIEFFIDYF